MQRKSISQAASPLSTFGQVRNRSFGEAPIGYKVNRCSCSSVHAAVFMQQCPCSSVHAAVFMQQCSLVSGSVQCAWCLFWVGLCSVRNVVQLLAFLSGLLGGIVKWLNAC